MKRALTIAAAVGIGYWVGWEFGYQNFYAKTVEAVRRGDRITLGWDDNLFFSPAPRLEAVE